MEVFRIHNPRYDALDALGAAMVGGRWNPVGLPVVYASPRYEGALLEQAVFAGHTRLPRNRVASRIVIPDDVEVPTLDVTDHPAWRDVPDSADWRTVAGHADWRDEVRSREIGTAWAASAGSVALLVPSFVAQPWGWNVMINPDHPEFDRVVVEETVDVLWDPRVVS